MASPITTASFVKIATLGAVCLTTAIQAGTGDIPIGFEAATAQALGGLAGNLGSNLIQQWLDRRGDTFKQTLLNGTMAQVVGDAIGNVLRREARAQGPKTRDGKALERAGNTAKEKWLVLRQLHIPALTAYTQPELRGLLQKPDGDIFIVACELEEFSSVVRYLCQESEGNSVRRTASEEAVNLAAARLQQELPEECRRVLTDDKSGVAYRTEILRQVVGLEEAIAEIGQLLISIKEDTSETRQVVRAVREDTGETRQGVTVMQETLAEQTQSLDRIEVAIGSLKPELPPAETPKPFMVPFPPNPFFVGREEELATLEAALAGGSVAAITQVVRGLGGMGKTQTAVEYAYRHRDDYSAVLWTRADDANALDAGFVNIARAWGLPEAGAQETRVAVEAAKRELSRRGGWLLIVDNADSPDLVPPYLPPSPQGHIIVTSRGEDFRGLGVMEPIGLKPLPDEDALAFFARSANLDRANAAEMEAAKTLAREVGYLPLALEQAAAYIVRKHRSFAAYLREFQTRREQNRLLEWQPTVGTSRVYDPKSDAYAEYLTVWTTWELNFEEVKRRDPDSADLLTLAAFLAADAIPVELVCAAFRERFAGCETAEDAESVYADLLLPLSDYSLITDDRPTATFSVHRMVQTVRRDRLDDAEREAWLRRAVETLNRVLPDPHYNEQGWETWGRLLPHALAVADVLVACPIRTNEVSLLLNQTAFYLSDRAQYALALPLYERALEIRPLFLKDSQNTATILNNLAIVYQEQGDFAAALPLYKQALEIRKKVGGKEHALTASSFNNLGYLYHAMGDSPAALTFFRQALDILRKVRGEEHPETAQTMTNLAIVYQEQGDLAAALPLCKQALEIYKRCLWEQHPATARNLNTLGLIYYTIGDFAAALPLYKQALAIMEKVLGTEHPHRANVCGNLADCYEAMDQQEEATRYFLRSEEIRVAHERRNRRDE